MFILTVIILQRALDIDLGFNYHNIVSLEVVFPPAVSPAKIALRRAALAQQLAALPDIESVAVTSHVPLVHGGLRGTTLTLNGQETLAALYTLVTPGYFETMRIPILRGRNFTADGVWGCRQPRPSHIRSCDARAV